MRTLGPALPNREPHGNFITDSALIYYSTMEERMARLTREVQDLFQLEVSL